MRRVLLDVNVVLDVLLDRRPFAEPASAVWAAVETGAAEGVLAAHSLTTLYYLNAKMAGQRMARDTTEALLSVFDVAAVDKTVLADAVRLGWADFEDAVTAAAARRSRCDVIVTRNSRDFRRSPVRVLTPSEAMAWIATSR